MDSRLRRLPDQAVAFESPLALGAAMGSLAVEGFSVDRFRDPDDDEWGRRWSILGETIRKSP